MPRELTTGLVRFLGSVAGLPGSPVLSDGELLTRFASGSGDAFAVLMRRHGPGVLGVCRRVLRDSPDVEDAFQATFLVLARKAASLRWPERLGGWLHGVAYNAASKARQRAARRRDGERRAARPVAAAPDEAMGRDLSPVLDAELRRLPDRLRTPVVLCYLQGRTVRDAARLMECPRGTVLSRLAKARGLLRTRLTRRGLTVTGGLVAAGAGLPNAAAQVPAPLLAATLRAALALSSGAGAGVGSAQAFGLARQLLRAASVARLRQVAAGALALAAVAVGACLAAFQSPAGPPSDPAPKAAPRAAEAPPADRLGDPLPQKALARLGTVRLRHGQMVQNASFSPDGRLLASASGDGVRVWDAATGKLRGQVGPAGRFAAAVAYASGGKVLATVDDRVHLWDAATLKPLRHFAKTQLLGTDVVFSGDGKYLATREQDGSLHIWTTATGLQVRHLPVNSFSFVLTSDFRTLATAAADVGDVQLWDVATGGPAGRLSGHGKMVQALALTADGKTLAAAGDDGVVRFWDLASRKELRQARAGALLAALAFTPDAQTLAGRPLGDGPAVRLWDVATAKEKLPALGEQTGRMMGSQVVTFAPDGKSVALSRGNALLVLDVATAKPRPDCPGHEGGIKSLSFAADGRTLVSGGDHGPVRQWHAVTGRQLRSVRPNPEVAPSVLSPDGKRLAAVAPDHKAVVVRDFATAAEVRRLPVALPDVPAGAVVYPVVFFVAFSGNGQTVAAASYANDTSQQTFQLWDCHTGRETGRFTLTGGMPTVPALSPDGQLVAVAGGFGGPVRLLKAGSGYDVQQLVGAASMVEVVAFSPDGRTLAAAGQGDEVLLWEVASGRPRRRLRGSKAGLLTLAFSADGRLLAAGGRDGRVVVWDLAPGKASARFEGHNGWVTCLAFAPDGKTLASGSDDTTALVWGLAGTSARAKTGPLAAADVARLVEALKGEAPAAYTAIARLADCPVQALPVLRDRLQPVKPASRQHSDKLVADLDSPQFAVRDAANRELQRLGELAAPALQRVLAGQPSVEMRRRVQALLDRCEGPVAPPEQLPLLRAVEVLERIGSAEARGVLSELASGAPEARLTREAQACLRRLARRPVSP
jgi:RNA polymerase sigma factor (sigma-70 family)